MSSSNATTFGVTLAGIQRRINPNFVASGLHFIAKASGTLSATTETSVTDASADWVMNEHQGLFVVAAGVREQILSNSATELVIASGGEAMEGDYEIRGESLHLTDAQFNELVARKASLVAGSIGEKYRQMLTRIDGEIAVVSASAGQTSIPLTYAPTPFSPVWLWLNVGSAWPANPVASLSQGANADFEVEAYEGLNRNSILLHRGGIAGAGLSRGMEVVVSYTHDMTISEGVAAVPKVLTDLVEQLVANDILRGVHTLTPSAAEMLGREYEETMKVLDRIGSGSVGISELDAIRLKEETTRAPTTGPFSVSRRS